MITTWSFSKLVKFEACKFRVKLQYIDRMPEPPLPPNNPMERGNREHKLYEDYVTGAKPDLRSSEARAINEFLPQFEKLRELYVAGMATAEDDWLFDNDWFACEKANHWLWAKLDFCVYDADNQHVIVGDFKTGKSQYKAIEHVQQTQLYALLAALKYPDADRITTELWYVDEGLIKSHEIDADRALSYAQRFGARADAMTSEKMFRPNPSRDICRYCPYSPRGTGACPVGV